MTADFSEWFCESVAVDLDGMPLTLYRGEHGCIERHGELISNVASLTFTDDPEVASFYACHPNDRLLSSEALWPRVYAAHLVICKPLINDPGDPFIDFSVLNANFGIEVAIEFALRNTNAILNTDNWLEKFQEHWGDNVHALLSAQPGAVDELYMEVYRLLDDPDFVALARAAGFDGCVYGGSGESALTAEYRIFDASQQKSAFIHYCDVVELASKRDDDYGFGL